MGDGIFAEIRVGGPTSCHLPMGGTDVTIDSVTRSVLLGGNGAVTEEFVVETADADDTTDSAVENAEGTRRVFDAGSRTVYRFDREQRGCACDRIEALGCPVRDVTVRDEGIVVTFFAADVEVLQSVITELTKCFDTVAVKRLLRSDPDESTNDLVFVDRSALTARQCEVLTVAHEMGYFAYPREANAETVASALDITTSTFTEHLAVAQSKLMDAILDDRP